MCIYAYMTSKYAYKHAYMRINMRMGMVTCIYETCVARSATCVYVHVACSYAYKHAYMGITMHMDMHICIYDVHICMQTRIYMRINMRMGVVTCII